MTRTFFHSVVITCFLLSVALLFVLDNNVYSVSYLLACFTIATVLTCGYVFYHQKCLYKGYFYLPSILLLVGYYLLNYQYVLDLLIGFKSYDSFVYPMVVNRMTIVSTIGMVGLICGLIVSQKQGARARAPRKSIVLNFDFLIILQILFFILWIFSVDFYSLISGRSYAGGINTYNNFELLFYVSTIAVLSSLIMNQNGKKFSSFRQFFKSNSILSWLITALYCIIRMISGDRGPSLFTLLAVFYTFVLTSNVKIKAFQVFVYSIIILFVLNTVGIYRKTNPSLLFGERVSSAFSELFGSDEARFSEKTILPLTEELAMSSICNQVAIKIIDVDNQPFHKGRFLYYGILQWVPFVPSYLMNVMGVPAIETSSDYYLTNYYLGDYQRAQMGTSCVADPYLDFGVIGVFLMMLLGGVIFGRIDFQIAYANVPSYVSVIFILLMASKAIYIPRSTVLGPLKVFIPVWVVYLFNMKVLNFKKTH